MLHRQQRPQICEYRRQIIIAEVAVERIRHGAVECALTRPVRMVRSMDTPLGNFVFNAEYRASEISGQWSTDNGWKGAWEATKMVTLTKSR